MSLTYRSPSLRAGTSDQQHHKQSEKTIIHRGPTSMKKSLIAMASFYKRPLPASCTSFLSPEGKKIFQNALAEGNMDSFFPLSNQYLTQNEPAFCGLGTLCMVLNSLEVDPQRNWKGPWRWYEQEMLDCCRPLSTVKEVGITLSEFACLARCSGLHATVTSPALVITDEEKAAGLRKFRDDLRRACGNEAEQIMAISYSRRSLGQTGDGHFSPIGGYSAADDKFLIMDVARFKYPSYWVSVEDGFNAMIPIDSATGQPRGYAMLSVLPSSDPTSLAATPSLTFLGLNKSSFAIVISQVSKMLLSLPKPVSAQATLDVMEAFLAALPTPPILTRPSSTTEEEASFKQLMEALKTSTLSKDPLRTLFLLALFRRPPTGLAPFLPRGAVNEELMSMMLKMENVIGEIGRKELEVLGAQLKALGECCKDEAEGVSGCSCSQFTTTAAAK